MLSSFRHLAKERTITLLDKKLMEITYVASTKFEKTYIDQFVTLDEHINVIANK